MQFSDTEMMQRALSLSLKARVISPPNPWVGCVIVKNGQVVGVGHTQPAGFSHAEVVALEQAKGLAAGATVYVTLEPCCHYGRTPPCTKTLIEAKVSRVVVGLLDPDSKVCGKGIEQLRAAGIIVEAGVLKDLILPSLVPYIYHRKTGLTYCIGKGAISIDGRIAAKDGSSKWISSQDALDDAHRLRAESQAIIIGANTALYDQPSLTARHKSLKPATQPLRVVLDSRGRIPATGPLFEDKMAPTLIVTSNKAKSQVIETWEAKGVEVVRLAENRQGNGIDLHQLVEFLGKRGILQALVEGGGTLLGSFLENNLLEHFHTYIGPCFLGSEGVPLIRTNKISTLSDSFEMQLSDVQLLGDTVNINYSK